MKPKQAPNLAASILQRLLNRARARSEDYNFTLSQYAIERFLFRLSQSRHRDRFVLKGASLFVSGVESRTERHGTLTS